MKKFVIFEESTFFLNFFHLPTYSIFKFLIVHSTRVVTLQIGCRTTKKTMQTVLVRLGRTISGEISSEASLGSSSGQYWQWIFYCFLDASGRAVPEEKQSSGVCSVYKTNDLYLLEIFFFFLVQSFGMGIFSG